MKMKMQMIVVLMFLVIPICSAEDDCPTITCAGDFCEFGNKHDHNGCPTCACMEQPCPNLECYMECPNGFERDSNGCPICMCHEECGPMPNCHECQYIPDDEGCPTCECQQSPANCTEPDCGTQECEHGYLLDANGCSLCYCRASTACGNLKCDNGGTCMTYETSWDKAMCICKPGFFGSECQIPGETVCEEQECQLRCDFGLMRDERGCETCRCRDEPVSCEPVKCRFICQHALVRDINGCEVCVCMSNPESNMCPNITGTCLKDCPDGFKTDSTGCDVYECTDATESPPDGQLPECPAFSCFLTCDRGYQQNEANCSLCACKNPSPCESLVCANGGVCLAYGDGLASAMCACQSGFQGDACNETGLEAPSQTNLAFGMVHDEAEMEAHRETLQSHLLGNLSSVMAVDTVCIQEFEVEYSSRYMLFGDFTVVHLEDCDPEEAVNKLLRSLAAGDFQLDLLGYKLVPDLSTLTLSRYYGRSTAAPQRQTTSVDFRSTAAPQQQTTSVDVRSTAAPQQQTTSVDVRSTAAPQQQTTSVDVRSTAAPQPQTTLVDFRSTAAPQWQTTSVDFRRTAAPQQQTTSVDSEDPESQQTMWVVFYSVWAGLALLVFIGVAAACIRCRRARHFYTTNTEMIHENIRGSLYTISTQKQDALLLKFDQLQ